MTSSWRRFSFLTRPLVLALFLLSSCAVNGGAPALPYGGPTSEKNFHTWNASGDASVRVLQKVPFYPQADHQCGPAAMAEVLDYYGSGVTPASIASSIYSKTARGTLGIDMLFYAQQAGFSARQYSGSKRDIMREIDRGRPLIVFVDYGFWVYQEGHFMVVAGYDAGGPIVHSLNGPFEHIPWDEFMGPWKKTGYWTLLITKKQKTEKTRESAAKRMDK